MRFERTGERGEFSEPGFNAIEMPDWSILIADGSDYFTEVGEEQAATLSSGGRSLLFTCSDTVMCTQLIEYAEGEELWRIDYEGAHGRSEAKISGRAPSWFMTNWPNRKRSKRKTTTPITSTIRPRKSG